MHTTQEKAPAIRRGPPKLPTLRLVYSGDAVRLPPEVITLARGTTRIGRDETHGVASPGDPRASRHHATLLSDVLGRLRIVDEKSRNGTFVNGVRVEESIVNDGDLIAVGDSYLVVRAEPDGLVDASAPSLVGVSPSLRALRRAIHSVGPTGATVLLLAESGCGKDVVARALHDIGRPGGPFVAVNCSAIPESIAESQLFGHLAGAFSGAVARPGLFRAADGDTLFLDEVGDLPEAIQPKLLPVGGTTPIPCDVRIVAATNRDLQADISARHFRGDLYARLAEYPISIPPLRERREDILLLLLLLHALGTPTPRLTPALAEALLLHAWPFNVARPTAESMPPPEEPVERGDDRADAGDKEPPPDRAALEALLLAHRGVVADVARAMRRSRKQVYRWIVNHQLDVARFRG